MAFTAMGLIVELAPNLGVVVKDFSLGVALVLRGVRQTLTPLFGDVVKDEEARPILKGVPPPLSFGDEGGP